MKVLFIYFNKEYRPRTLLSLSLLETVLQKEGHETKIFDTSFYLEFLDPWEFNAYNAGILKPVDNLQIPAKNQSAYLDLKKLVEEFSPELVCFTYYVTQQEMQRSLLIPLKKDFPSLKIIAGGPQVMIAPGDCIKEPYLDMVGYGEGEDILKDLCKKMEKGENFDDVKGLWIKNKDGSIKKSAIAPLVDMDQLPPQNWDSYDPIQIHGFYEGKAYRMGHVEFTRGCPFPCTYCGAGSIMQGYAQNKMKYVRHKKVEIAIAEYKHLKEKYNLEMFYFIDGTFNLMPDEVLKEFSALYKKEVNLPFIALIRPERVTEAQAKYLGEMNCAHVSVGVESGVEEYRRKILGRNMTNEQIVTGIQRLVKNGVHVSAFNMIGLPGMDRKHVFETIKLNKETGANSCIPSIFIPFPDNTLTQTLLKQGLITEDDIKITVGTTPTVKIKEMTADEIMGLYNTFNAYVKLPKITYPFIKLLEKENRVTRYARKKLYQVIR